MEQLVRALCDNKQGYTQFGGLRPFGVSLLYGGWCAAAPLAPLAVRAQQGWRPAAGLRSIGRRFLAWCELYYSRHAGGGIVGMSGESLTSCYAGSMQPARAGTCGGDKAQQHG